MSILHRRNRLLLAALVLIACLVPLTADAAKPLPAGETVWQGEVTLVESVRVPPESVLVIRKGSRIKIESPAAMLDIAGTLRIEGSRGTPVIFDAPKGWQGISFIEAKKGSVIRGVDIRDAESAISSIATDFSVTDSRFSGCTTAVKLLRESAPLIEGNRFIDNGIGVDNEMRSNPTIRNNRFIGHGKTAILASHNSRGLIAGNHFEKNEQGVGLLQSYPDRVVDNVFIANKVALYCNQTKNTPLIRYNRFEKNEMALVNYSFAYPVVEDNSFSDNGTAIRNDQYGSPRVFHNRFSNNGTAIYNYRKSNPVVENNLVEGGELALFCDYSSYPTVRNNHFADNRMAVELGIYQSADWEKRSGSKTLMQKEAQARNSKNVMLSQAPTKFRDVVDVSHNWWGEKTPLLVSSGADGNLPFFFDRLDKEWVVYEGFGPERYRMDRIIFSPWLEKPLDSIGPRGKK